MRTTGFSGLLSATVVGVYVLVVVGATAALADAAAACQGWPLCGGDLSDPSVPVAVLHRGVAAVVGLLVIATAVVGWSETTARVKTTLALALALYPAQVVLGALVATGSALANLHLFVAMAIFAVLVVGLAWHLEAETGSDDAPESPPELAPPVDEEPAATEQPALSGLARAKATARAYFELTKPRLMWLLCLVAGAGMVIAGTPTVRTVVFTLGGGVLAIGASGTFNHVLERDIDRRMERTSDRPIATHEVPVANALAFGGLLAVASLWAFLSVNLLAAALGLAAIAFYSVVYTLILKPNTVQNTVIGGAAGALPALIGYAAVTGTIGIGGLVLAAVIFLWTPAHFYNLALAYKDDYERGGFPMMPVVRGETETRKHIVFYLGATLLGAGALAAVTDLGWLYAATAVLAAGVFLWAVVELHYEQTDRAAFRSFHASNAYLGLVLVAILIDSLAV
ncbi:protoheme IX geranylgeranyltransferase [Natronomonas pharaonis DSM 2160]|uniref:Protoheme IX farnesyltransferase 1 n=1 Tax=Natronomonas pharaonis (strain ATCC 35678 / DSM 2160 / CIP 103997 / JCM 8858 / NBRC 14720 / NCIMB 2260 / Gabara) TaxID=348780 RepID=COXX1_NATPD|nr:heme o synthase [Natronomonas pharaonis]Q3IRC9.1 RecName: Full=Protoheme IX farnesyltransferase 1; AltName: Full=Heme B farnesyltransferase 1; AltName: Full=Heme O synthase 1 [Natronomonas pharaonis DSM 2160]CAI49314.1 protoheme IX geranylgeranyltransferase [Natronomonas pharaonis DSM 2160]